MFTLWLYILSKWLYIYLFAILYVVSTNSGQYDGAFEQVVAQTSEELGSNLDEVGCLSSRLYSFCRIIAMQKSAQSNTFCIY